MKRSKVEQITTTRMNSGIVHSITHEMLNHLHHCSRSTSGNMLLMKTEKAS